MFRLSRINKVTRFVRAFASGNLGDGAGRGGGDGGSIRSAGGGFGRMAVAKEEEYFYKKQREDLKRLAETLNQPSSEFPTVSLKKEAARLKQEMEELTKRMDIGEEKESEILHKYSQTKQKAHEIMNKINEWKKDDS